jgi:hypothetical protein
VHRVSHIGVSWLIGLALAFGQASLARAESNHPGDGTAGAPLALGVLPLANYTGSSEAPAVCMALVCGKIGKRGVAHLSDRELRPILRHHRIRSTGQISAADAAIIRQQTLASHLLLGSIDIYRSGDNPEVGLSVRILDTGKMRIIRAASAAASGEDFASLFGIGRVDSVQTVAAKVVENLFEELGEPLLQAPASHDAAASCSRLALIPFDSSADYDYAGGVVTNMLLSMLVSDGYYVVEPGLVNQLFLDERVMPRGQLDLNTLSALRARHDLCFVVTGEVERFRAARGDPRAAVPPELALGVRVLDAETGRLVMSIDEETSGADSETLFRAGRQYSLGRLAQKTLRRVARQIDEGRRNTVVSDN